MPPGDVGSVLLLYPPISSGETENDASERNAGAFPLRKRPMKEIIAEVQSMGIRVPGSIMGRKGGAGPAEGRAFLIDGIPVNVPIAAPYVASSPFVLKESGNDRFILFRHAEPVAQISVVPEPRFYGQMGPDGIGYRQIALLHGRDCLATTVLQRCVHWRSSGKCAFCGTEISLRNGATIARKRPAQLADVARVAAKRDGVAHVVLTSGNRRSAGQGNTLPCPVCRCDQGRRRSADPGPVFTAARPWPYESAESGRCRRGGHSR